MNKKNLQKKDLSFLSQTLIVRVKYKSEKNLVFKLGRTENSVWLF